MVDEIIFNPNIVRNSKYRGSYSINIDKNTKEDLGLEKRFDELKKKQKLKCTCIIKEIRIID